MIGHPNPTSNEIEGRDSGINAFDDAKIARQNAIKQIELRRHFRIQAAMTAVGAMILILIWALTEYHNAGGWPTHGFSQSSGIHDVWNFWIVYPIGGLVLIFSGRAWFVYRNKPITEQEIKKEIERQSSDSK